MKKLFVLFLSGVLTLSLAACSGNESPSTQSSSQASEPEIFLSESDELVPSSGEPSTQDNSQTADPGTTPSEDEEPAPTDGETVEQSTGSNMLVAYFSYAENANLPEGVDASAGASIQVWNGGTTGNTGLLAAMIAEATGADLFSVQTVEKYPDSYDATLDQAQEERNANARPELATHVENLDNYDVVFLGFPNWWGDMPMAMYSFLEEVDLSGKTIVPFVTSGGSGFSNTVSTIASMEPDATMQEGLSIGGSDATSAQDRVNEWLGELGYTE